MKTFTFAKRVFKEIIRDPISLIFCVALPIFLLIIFQQFNIPSNVYNINNFAPSIIIFGFGFLSLFSGTLISKDRSTSMLNRLFSSPLKISNFIAGYLFALIPIALMQSVLFLLVGLLFNLNISIYILPGIFLITFLSVLYVLMGILVGCLFNDKQAPAFGSLIIQLITFTSGMWFEIDSLSNTFKIICNILPFRYTVDLAKACIQGNFHNMMTSVLIIGAYIVLFIAIDVLLFKKKMESDNK